MENGLILIKQFPYRKPGRMEPLEYGRRLSWAEYMRVRRGFFPCSPADKWLIYFRKGRVFFRRTRSEPAQAALDVLVGYVPHLWTKRGVFQHVKRCHSGSSTTKVTNEAPSGSSFPMSLRAAS